MHESATGKKNTRERTHETIIERTTEINKGRKKEGAKETQK